MPQTLYFSKIKFSTGPLNGPIVDKFETFYGVQPRDEQHTTAGRRISLKNDLRWREVQNLQRIMREADFWPDFPEPNVRLISAEVKAGNEPQRIDLLYLRSDGTIFPCELKVGGVELDTHGQLIRYIADLSNQTISKQWAVNKRLDYLHRKYAGTLNAEINAKVDLLDFENFIGTIPENDFRLSPNTGMIIDEGFPSTLVTAVRYLNLNCGFSIRLIQADAHVSDNWTFDTEEYFMRLDFNEIGLV